MLRDILANMPHTVPQDWQACHSVLPRLLFTLGATDYVGKHAASFSQFYYSSQQASMPLTVLVAGGNRCCACYAWIKEGIMTSIQKLSTSRKAGHSYAYLHASLL